MAADDIIARLRLEPHPEGGFYRETFRDDPAPGEARAQSTAIYFLLPAGTLSRWHRVDAAEVWHFYAGGPLQLDMAASGDAQPVRHRLGANIFRGEAPQVVVPAGHWQQARSLGAWTLVGCTVAPGFRFEGFEIAGRDFEPSTAG